jgi:anionic cell wall polymer biosynthesis LytR-Cps2A-Psr (LCP) family protein
VGGVTIDVDRTIRDDSYPTPDGGTISVQFDPGVQAMDGERALIYARTRHADDDYRRAERQQQVISALSQRLINPLRWPVAVRIITRSMDTNLSLWDMASAAPTVLLNAGRFERFVIERSTIITDANGNAIPNYSLITPWLAGRFQ